MTGRLYADIETVNIYGSRRDIARPHMKIDSRLKDPEKIEAAYEDKLNRTALDGLWGEIVAVAFGCDDQPIEVITRGADSSLIVAPHELTERWLLESLKFAINMECEHRWHKSTPQIIGHNVLAFDIRFLYQRYIVNGLTVPHWLPVKVKPWETDKVFDTMIEWAGVGGRVKLSALCAGLGIEVPETISGADVPQAWLDGRYDEIRDHVLADVEAVRAVHRRMSPPLEFNSRMA